MHPSILMVGQLNLKVDHTSLFSLFLNDNYLIKFFLFLSCEVKNLNS